MNYEICNFPSFLEILIDIWLVCLHIVKSNDPNIMFLLQGILIFSLQCMRNNQVRKNIKPIINSISSVFSVSINIRVLVLRTIFHVVRISADQRAIQKKDECCFSIFYKEQLHKEELTGQSKWGRRCMGSGIAVLCCIWIQFALNLDNWIQPTGNDSQLLSKITYLTAIGRLWFIWPAICSWKEVYLFIIV